MSSNTSPAKYIETNTFMDLNYTADINRKMNVPNKISMNGVSNDYEVNEKPNNYSNEMWTNMHMQVPERILVAGQEQHIGTRAPPREIVLDNSMLSTEPERIRVHSPPRVITLDKYQFPVVEEREADNEKEDLGRDEMMPVAKSSFNTSAKETRLAHRESTPPIGSGGEGLSTSEEVLHLRRQMAKLNRRMMSIELDNINRQQREKIIYGVGIAYFLLKMIVWLNRS